MTLLTFLVQLANTGRRHVDQPEHETTVRYRRLADGTYVEERV